MRKPAGTEGAGKIGGKQTGTQIRKRSESHLLLLAQFLACALPTPKLTENVGTAEQVAHTPKDCHAE